ncbi:MAG: FAD-binding oxidoreductase, partial [Tepidisphaeraceae bacterium]
MTADAGIFVNDVHSRLNPTRVADLRCPLDADELASAIRDAAERSLQISVCGARHAMGGQQFGADTMLIDMTGMSRPVAFDAERGLIEIQAGADWPAVIRATHEAQAGPNKRWGIRQKQTGADALSLGGALAANVHGRGLLMQPIVDDVEAFTLMTGEGELLTCSRERHGELFSLVIGGYGLFGIVVTVTLRLGPRWKLRRLVDVLDIDDAIGAVRRRAGDGCLYGDFQYSIDPSDDSFLRRGVCACYQPEPQNTPVSDESADLSTDEWVRLLRLAQDDKRRAFQEYALHYLATHGRIYWSDTMQLSTYLPNYSQLLERAGGSDGDESLVLGEQYVPADALGRFL